MHNLGEHFAHQHLQFQIGWMSFILKYLSNPSWTNSSAIVRDNVFPNDFSTHDWETTITDVCWWKYLEEISI
jgi:hypothetical protein